jgi:hypothetical protein
MNIPQRFALLTAIALGLVACTESSGGRKSGSGSTSSGSTSTGGSAALPAPQQIAPSIGVPLGTHDLEVLEATFHKATPYTRHFEQSRFKDRGGTLFAFVRNISSRVIDLNEVRVDGRSVPDGPLLWWRAWPTQIGPGEVSTVTVKATDLPLAEGNRAQLEIRGNGGAAAPAQVECATPAARIGHVACDLDAGLLKVFLRNDGFANVEVVGVRVNGDELLPRTTFAGASGATLAPRALTIARVHLAGSLLPGAPLALRLKLRWANGRTEWLGAPLRAFPTWFPLGTWAGSMNRDPAGKRMWTSLQGDRYTGSSNAQRSIDAYQRFGLRNLLSKKNSGVIDRSWLQTHGAHPAFGAWRVSEEPDLGNETSDEVLALNQVYWEEAPTKPTFVNTATANAFGEYAPVGDIAATDHYVGFNAPSTIFGTWIIRPADVEEALWFAEHLKQTVEPKPTWIWTQLAGNMWDAQPTPYFVDVQFWSQIMAGAKGLLWFKYGPGYESDPKFSVAVAEADRLGRMLAPIRNLLGDCDVAGAVGSSQARVEGRLLVGEEACVVVAVNFDYQIVNPPLSTMIFNAANNISPLQVTYDVATVQGTLIVDLPDWIQPDAVSQVTPNGLVPVGHQASGQRITIPYMNLHEQGLAFVIGKRDVSAPSAPKGLSSPDASTLAWRAAKDDRGVTGYRVYRAGVEVDAVPHTWSDRTAQPGNYTVRAFDGAGNLGPPSAAFIR